MTRPLISTDDAYRALGFCSICHDNHAQPGSDRCGPCTPSLLAEFCASLDADVDEALTCRVCGAKGFDACDLARHVTNLASFAAVNARTHRIAAINGSAPAMTRDEAGDA